LISELHRTSIKDDSRKIMIKYFSSALSGFVFQIKT
jgi:hypothetical protein